MKSVILFFAVGILFLASGCMCVQPQEKQQLSKYGMRPDRAALEDSLVEHMLFSRENGFVGKSVGGAGCGCN